MSSQPAPLAAGLTDGRTARRTQTRARVVTAAARLMADRGVTGTSMDDVAAEAGVSKGSVFYNFGSKDGLCRAVLDSGVEQFTDALALARDGRTGWSALDAAVETMLASIDRCPDLGQVLATELFRRGRAWQDDLVALRARLTAPLVAVLAEVHAERAAAGRAQVVPDRDHFETVAVSFLGAVMFAALDRREYAPDRGLAELHDTLMLTVSGLRG